MSQSQLYFDFGFGFRISLRPLGLPVLFYYSGLDLLPAIFTSEFLSLQIVNCFNCSFFVFVCNWVCRLQRELESIVGGDVVKDKEMANVKGEEIMK